MGPYEIRKSLASRKVSSKIQRNVPIFWWKERIPKILQNVAAREISRYWTKRVHLFRSWWVFWCRERSTVVQKIEHFPSGMGSIAAHAFDGSTIIMRKQRQMPGEPSLETRQKAPFLSGGRQNKTIGMLELNCTTPKPHTRNQLPYLLVGTGSQKMIGSGTALTVGLCVPYIIKGLDGCASSWLWKTGTCARHIYTMHCKFDQMGVLGARNWSNSVKHPRLGTYLFWS